MDMDLYLLAKSYIEQVKNTIPTKTSDLLNDSNFATSTPEEYITNTELTAALTDYAKVYELAAKANSSEVYTTTETDELLINKVDKAPGKSLVSDAEILRLSAVDNYNHTNVDNHMANNSIHVTSTDKERYEDKYTKNEVDNKISQVITSLDWKESVATFSEIATTYPAPEEGWTVSVDDDDTTYRYNGTVWKAISANSIPLATSSVDGKMSSADKSKLDAISANAKKVAASSTNGNIKIDDVETQVYRHPATHSPSEIVQDANNRFTSDAEKTNWNNIKTEVEEARGTDLDLNARITNLSLVKDAAAEIVRDSIPSGFQKLGDIDYTTMATSPNTIKLSSESVAYVNGYKTTIPAGTVITLNAPPTTGSREDLVFLECWKQTDASGAITWNSRIRVVDGVDFSLLPKDGMTIDAGIYYSNNYGINPKDTNANLVSTNTSTTQTRITSMYRWAKYSNGTSVFQFLDDCGLFITGDGTSYAKTTLGTTDGYTYAIPMFRVKRRNSGGYSVSNGNGSKPFLNYKTSPSVYKFGSTSVTLNNVDGINVGDIITDGNNHFISRVVSIDTTSKTLTTTPNTYQDYPSGYGLWFLDRPMGSYKLIYADTILDRDIIDLRHQVSLTGFNYQQLLEENFDKLLRGELQTTDKTKMLKTYHGIAKTPIDANHVFYASFDGTTVAEVGAITNWNISKFGASPTGLGAYGLGVGNIAITPNSIICLDFWYKPVSGSGQMLNINVGNLDIQLDIWFDTLFIRRNSGVGDIVSSMSHGKFYKIRWVVDMPNKKMYIYINGRLMNAGYPTITASTDFSTATALTLYTPNSSIISDMSISNIDRGAVFATLPQDFIDGYARISPAFNEQRQIYSDALTSEYKSEIVRATGETKKQYTITQATAGTWASGDTLKVKGLGGEIISGVIDSDTALCKLVSFDDGSISNTKTTVKVDDVSKISVNDTIRLLLNGALVDVEKTITAIDIVNKIVTLNLSISTSDITQFYIIESTASTSSPVVKSALGTVTGTWSGLGTNQATFTFGTNASLTNQDVQVEYSLNEIAGQGGISEVLTTTLAGESNGKKLVINPTVHIRDDFAGKDAGSVIVNPSISKYCETSGTLLQPSSASFNEMLQSYYDVVKSLDGGVFPANTSISTAIPQQLFSFNLIRIVEDKFGPIPALDIAGKVAWLKANIASIKFNWWGYGACPSGYKSSISAFWVTDGNWHNTASSTSAVVSNMNIPLITTGLLNSIDTNGFIHFLAYTDASNGVTASNIYTDYVNIELTLTTPTGYDVLAPENPRRDDAITLVSADMNVTDDFTGKVAGSVVENPNRVAFYGNSGLVAPSLSAYEFDQPRYNYVNAIGGTNATAATNTNGQIAQQLFSFNLIKIVEKKYGTIPATDKVAWLKANLSKITCNWWGYGSCPSGNKAYLTVYINGTWNSPWSQTQSSPSLLVGDVLSANITNIIDSNGMVHYLAYTDSSNGVTASSIFTDYVNIDVTLSDTAISQLKFFETKRGKGNVLLVRKETKEIQTRFNRNNADGVVTYGDYVPKQHSSGTLPSLYQIQEGRAFITSYGTGKSFAPIYDNGKTIRNCLSQIRKDNSILYKLTNDVLINDNSYYALGATIERRQMKLPGVFSGTGDNPVYSIPMFNNLGLLSDNFLLVLAFVFRNTTDGTLKLFVESINSKVGYTYEGSYFEIENRPLIK